MKITNEECPRRANEKLSLLNTLYEKQSRPFGHILRKGGIENVMTTGIMEGRKRESRPREEIFDGWRKWPGRSTTAELTENTRSETLGRHGSQHGLWWWSFNSNLETKKNCGVKVIIILPRFWPQISVFVIQINCAFFWWSWCPKVCESDNHGVIVLLIRLEV